MEKQNIWNQMKVDIAKSLSVLFFVVACVCLGVITLSAKLELSDETLKIVYDIWFWSAFFSLGGQPVNFTATGIRKLLESKGGK